MGTVSVVRVSWTGPAVVGGGVNTFYTVGDPVALATALGTLYGVIKNQTPAATFIRVESDGPTYDEADGTVTGAWSGGPTTIHSSSTAGVYAGGVGYRIEWSTAGVTGRRRVKGSTYIVPIVGIYYDSAGTLDDTMVGTMQTALNTFRAAAGAGAGVWSKPTPLRDPATGAVIPPPPWKYSGIMHDWTGARVVDKVSWLRSRRT